MIHTPDIACRLVAFPKVTKAALLTDSNVDRLYGDDVVRQVEATGLLVERIVFPVGEQSKNLETYAELVRGPLKPDKCRAFPYEWTNPDFASVCTAPNNIKERLTWT